MTMSAPATRSMGGNFTSRHLYTYSNLRFNNNKNDIGHNYRLWSLICLKNVEMIILLVTIMMGMIILVVVAAAVTVCIQFCTAEVSLRANEWLTRMLSFSTVYISNIHVLKHGLKMTQKSRFKSAELCVWDLKMCQTTWLVRTLSSSTGTISKIHLLKHELKMSQKSRFKPEEICL